jgi:hypothetical protein
MMILLEVIFKNIQMEKITFFYPFWDMTLISKWGNSHHHLEYYLNPSKTQINTVIKIATSLNENHYHKASEKMFFKLKLISKGFKLKYGSVTDCSRNSEDASTPE